MKVIKKIISILCCFLLMICVLTENYNVFITAQAVSVTPDAAIEWAKAQVGKRLDYDGVFEEQCVDLIMYYYQFLGVTPTYGNGCDYATNPLPDGWSRVYQGTPQKGDILVYAGNSANPNGHVAIYESDYSTYHQNFWNNPHLTTHETLRYTSVTNPYWGYIRPNWASTSVNVGEPTVVLYPTDGSVVKFASALGNNMYLDFVCGNNNVQIYENADNSGNPDWVKSQYFKLIHVNNGWYAIVNTGNGLAVDVTGASTASGTNIQQWQHTNGSAQLFRFYDAGNGYCYIKSNLGCYVDVVNGNASNNANVWAYTFNASSAQKWRIENHSHNSVVTLKPTCTTEGTRTYNCYCGVSYTEKISALGHDYKSEWTIDKQPTATTAGEKSHHCTRCNSKTDITAIPALENKKAGGTCGDNLTWTLFENGKLIISGSGDMYNYQHVNIPNFPWYSNRNSIKSVIISDGVTSIGNFAFYGCKGLTSITISGSVTSIGYYAFYDCTGLKSITIPGSVTSIGNWAFCGCSGLTSITISDSVTGIGGRTFSATGYYNNESNWKDGLLYIGKHLVAAKENILGAVNIKAGTKTIASSAFYGCRGLTSITIPDSVTSIGNGAFFDCDNVTVNCYKNSEAHKYVLENDISFNIIGTVQKDKNTGISVTYDKGVFGDKNVSVKFEKKTTNSVKFPANYEKAIVYDISFFVDNKEVQPNGTVTVKIPVPTGYNTKSLKVYHEKSGGTLEEVKFTLIDGCAVFEATSFSNYILVDTSSVKKDNTPTYTLGDVDGNGTITAADARLALRASVGLEKYSKNSKEFLASDVNKNGKIEASDARTILRVSVKLEKI